MWCGKGHLIILLLLFPVNHARVLHHKFQGLIIILKIYFSKKTEEAIIEYNLATDMVIRNEIYENRIKYSFDKLVENRIEHYLEMSYVNYIL